MRGRSVTKQGQLQPRCHSEAWGLFLKGPGNLTGSKSYFEIKVLRKVGRALTSNEVHFVSLADNLNA